MSYLAMKEEQAKGEITDHGTGEKGRFYYNKTTGTFERTPEKKSYKAIHTVIEDSMAPHISDVDGETVFTSKSAYKKHVEANGFRITGKVPEVKAKEPYKSDYNELRRDAERAINENKWGSAPLTEKERHDRLCGNDEIRREKEWCKRNNKKYWEY